MIDDAFTEAIRSGLEPTIASKRRLRLHKQGVFGQPIVEIAREDACECELHRHENDDKRRDECKNDSEGEPPADAYRHDLGFENVAHTAHGVDQIGFPFRVQLLTQIADVNLDRVGLDIKVVSPNLLE